MDGDGTLISRPEVSQDQNAFVRAGLRCGTRAPNAQAEDRLVRGNLGRSTGPPVAFPVTIPVHFHVITSSSGVGALSAGQIADQIDILNDVDSPD